MSNIKSEMTPEATRANANIVHGELLSRETASSLITGVHPRTTQRRLTFPMDRSRRLSASFERQLSTVVLGAGHLEHQISVVAEHTSAKAKDAFLRFVNYSKVNLTLAATIIFLSLYITFVSVLQRDFMHPIKYEDEENITWIETSTTASNSNEPTLSEVDLHINSALSMFILWLSALTFGSLFEFCRLPNIIGILMTGIAFKNIPFLTQILYIDSDWSKFFRKMALTIVLMRAGMGLDPVALRKTKATVLRLGIISTLCETGAIILASHFIFGVGLPMSILAGTILSATGPAVTIPAVLDLIKKGYGSSSELPTAILASCTMDNMTCIIAYTIAAALIFTTVQISYEIAMTFTTIVISVVGGIVGGRILWVFPHKGSHHRHFIRGVLLLSVCLALNFGTMAIGSPSCGVIATVLLNMVATIKWKKDSGKYMEADSLALMWNFFAMQIMFALIGFEFDIKRVSNTFVTLILLIHLLRLAVVMKAVSIIGIGQIARITSNFFLSFGGGLRVAEHFLITFSFVSKATLQAALAPQVADKSQGSAMYHEAVLLRTACVFAIFFLGPLGQLIFIVFGPMVLKSKSTQKTNDIDAERIKTVFTIETEGQTGKGFDAIEEQNEDSSRSST